MNTFHSGKLSPNSIKVNQSLQIIKKSVFPFITTGLLILFYSFPSRKVNLWGYKAFESNFWISFQGILAISLLFITCVLTGTLGLRWINSQKIHPHQISFLSTWIKKDLFSLVILYPITLLMEELLFRGLVLLVFQFFIADWIKILSTAIIFGLYHIHIWFTTRNLNLTALFIQASLLIGITLSIFQPYIGIYGCWIIHLVGVTSIYLYWINRVNLSKS